VRLPYIIVTFFCLSSAFLFNQCSKNEIKPAPVAIFSFTGYNRPAPCEVTFSNTSTEASTYLWEFGEGGASTDQNPKHTYTNSGTFTVKLTAVGTGGSNSITKSVTILSAVLAPVAAFSFSGDNQSPPCEVTFTNSSQNANSYSWNFVDGATSTELNPKHTYTASGSFAVSLTATGSGGTNSVTKNVTIQNTVANPVANFTLTGDNNFAPCKVTFTNSSTNATSYSWDFGDGQSSTDPNPNHIFANGGTFNVTLTAKNSANTQSVINKSVVIKNRPTRVRLNSFVITSFPFTKPDGSSWDVFYPAPDMTFSIYVNTLVFESPENKEDMAQSVLPFTVSTTFGLPLTFNSVSTEYQFGFWDDDAPATDK